MADKQQNILINYQFNTDPVDRAGASLNRANAASNTLQANAQKAGQSISQSFSQGTRSILSMEIELQRLKTQIQVTTDPTRVNQLSAQYKKLASDISAANQKAFGGAKPAIDSANSSLGGLVRTAGAFITVGLAKEALNITLGLAELQGKVEGVERAFSGRFPNSINLLNKLREATHGTVTDFELMQRTLQATNLGIAVEKLPTLLAFAATRAQQTGQSVDYLVESIVNGIGRKSPLILDNLGISAVRLKQKFDGATLASQSIGDVTRAVGEIIEEEMGKSGSYVETAATKVQQLNVAWENIRLTVAKKVTSGGLVDFMTESIKLLDEGIQSLASGPLQYLLDQQNKVIENSASNKAALVIESQAYQDLGDDVEGKIKLLQKEITETERVAQVRKDEIQQNQELITATEKRLYAESLIGLQTGKSIKETEKATGAIKLQTEQQQRSLAILEATIPFLKEYVKELQNVGKVPVEVDPSGIISRKKDDIEALRKEIELTNNMADLQKTVTVFDEQGNAQDVLMAGRLIVKLEILQAELADLQRAYQDIDIKPFKLKLEDATKAVTDHEGIIKRMEESLRNIQLTVPPPPPLTVAPKVTFWDELRGEFEDNWREIAAASTDIVADFGKGLVDADIAQLQQRLSLAEEFYSNQQKLAGDNARARTEIEIKSERELSKIRNEIAGKEKKARRSQAIIDGAAGVVKAFATVAWPYSLIVAGLIAASTGVQIGKINKEPDRFAKGVIDLKGPGTTTSDSIPVRLSKHESVMTAEETFSSRQVLKDVRARKLDDRMLKQLRQGRSQVHVQSQRFDDRRIVDVMERNTRAIKENRPPDVVQQGNIVYNVRQHSDTLRRKVRSKSINL